MTRLVSPPISGLADLSVEARVLATPWSRIVRGIGLGQHPVGYDSIAAAQIRRSFDVLGARLGDASPYSTFSRAVAELALDVTDPAQSLTPAQVAARVERARVALGAIANPYSRVTAGCILLSAVAKLGVDASLVIDAPGARDLPAEILAAVDLIQPDGIQDENHGRHGDYERVAAWTAVFLAFGQADIGHRLVTPGRDRVAEAAASLPRIPAPFFRGRGGSTLVSAIALLGRGDALRAEGTDVVGGVFAALDDADRIGIHPAFPSPMSAQFVAIYPLLTMLNAVAVANGGRVPRERIADASRLMAELEPVERTHMALYYVMALHNLGRLDDDVPDLDAFVEPIVAQWRTIDPGRDYFLYGISYPYLAQLAYFTGRADLITEQMLDRMVGAFPSLELTAEGRANRPYPFAYALNIAAELGVGELFSSAHPAYGGRAPYDWVVDHLSPGGRVESARLYMLDHALVGWALRMRAPGSVEPGVLGRFSFARGGVGVGVGVGVGERSSRAV